ncbi:hypothetical protein ABT120_05720 [Nonomuraea angiospora]
MRVSVLRHRWSARHRMTTFRAAMQAGHAEPGERGVARFAYCA